MGRERRGETNQPAGGWLSLSSRAREPVPHLHVALRVLKDGVPEPLVKTGRLVLVLRPEIADVAARDCTCSNQKEKKKVKRCLSCAKYRRARSASIKDDYEGMMVARERKQTIVATICVADKIKGAGLALCGRSHFHDRPAALIIGHIACH
jgi:hypothetical protein